MRLSLKKVKQTEWIYIDTREMPLIFVSLIAESFKHIFLKFNLKEFGRSYIDSTYCLCRNGLIVDTFRDKKVFLSCLRHLIKKLANGPKFLNNLYKTSLQDVEKINIISRKIKSSVLKFKDFKEFYLLYRPIFLSFFTLQAFPLIIERVLTDIDGKGGKKLLKKYKDILVKWRKNTHKAELKLENLLFLFLNKSKKQLKIDFSFWTDYELITYFETRKKPYFSEIRKRKRMYLLVGGINLSPPYKIYNGQKLKKVYKFLLEITKPKAIGNKFQGKAVYKGDIRGRVCVVRNKKELKNLSPNKILVVRVVEMDDFRVLKNKKIKGIITEEGGITTHINIVGRELKIPIITKIKGAISIFRNGDLVEVDANKGIVKIIERAK